MALPRCTAPKMGHQSRAGAEACPLHGYSGAPGRVDPQKQGALDFLLPPANEGPPAPSRPRTLDELLALPATAPVGYVMSVYHAVGHESRLAFAGDPRTRTDVLRRLAEAHNCSIRAAVAGNEATDEAMLRTFAEDPDAEVRIAVVRNPKRPPDLLDALSHDSVLDVRKVVATCHQTPFEALDRLAHDRRQPVRATALENPVWPRDDLERLAVEFRDTTEEQGLAGNVKLPPEMLREIALRAPRIPGKGESRKYRAAANPSTPEDALLALADADLYDSGLMRNPKVPSSVVQRIAEEGRDPTVQNQAREVRAARIFESTGVQPDNVGAQDYLIGAEWWALTPESPEVSLALVLSPDQ